MTLAKRLHANVYFVNIRVCASSIIHECIIHQHLQTVFALIKFINPIFFTFRLSITLPKKLTIVEKGIIGPSKLLYLDCLFHKF